MAVFLESFHKQKNRNCKLRAFIGKAHTFVINRLLAQHHAPEHGVNFYHQKVIKFFTLVSYLPRSSSDGVMSSN